MADPKEGPKGPSIDFGSRATWREFGHALVEMLLGEDDEQQKTTTPKEESHGSDSDHPDERTEPGVIDVELEADEQ